MPKEMGYGKETLGYDPNKAVKSAAWSGKEMKTNLGSEQYLHGKGSKKGYGTGKR